MRAKMAPVVFILCWVLLAASGCGKSSSPAATRDKGPAAEKPAQKIVNPCFLITKEEAEAALGEPVQEPEFEDAKNPLGQKLCHYNPKSESSQKFIQISVVQNEGMSKILREQEYNVAKLFQETKKNLETQPVPGIGEDAFWGTPGLHVLKGSVYFVVGVGNTDLPANLELAKSLAQKAASRL